ncbi:GspH/FimT family pseudopilin [Vreelandella glaciei]|uniref:GspH/FimT family pseudopilin n=1 Tax=Vreelandella glaciei TaxID=186761 RepID=UPI0030EE293D|tara:strand:+ start:428 stop:928 length:501 start_codon:yes stop_codon:yes gene_type:complete
MSQRGFTLIELLITLLIATIIAVMTVPAFSDFLTRQQLSADVNEMVSVLSFARSEAIKQRQNVTVEFLPPGECGGLEGMVEDKDSLRWCYGVKSEEETMRVGRTANITMPNQTFSLTFLNLGDANIDKCSSPCHITLSPQRQLEEEASLTLAINITGSIRRQDLEP